jgi:hypothetical protein
VGDTNFIATVGAARVLPVALEELYDAVAPGFTGGEGHPIDLQGG